MMTSKKLSLALLIIVGASQVQASEVASEIVEKAIEVVTPQASKMERFKNFSKKAALTVYDKARQNKGKIALVGATAAVAAAAMYKREALIAYAKSALDFGRTQTATLWSKMPSLRKASVVVPVESVVAPVGKSPTFGQWIAGFAPSSLGETQFVKDGGLYGVAERAFASSDVVSDVVSDAVSQPEVLSRTQRAMAFLANGARPFNWLKEKSVNGISWSAEKAVNGYSWTKAKAASLVPNFATTGYDKLTQGFNTVSNKISNLVHRNAWTKAGTEVAVISGAATALHLINRKPVAPVEEEVKA